MVFTIHRRYSVLVTLENIFTLSRTDDILATYLEHHVVFTIHCRYSVLVTLENIFTLGRVMFLSRILGLASHGCINRHATLLANQFSFLFITNCYTQPETPLQESQDAVHSTSNPRGLQRCPNYHCQRFPTAVPVHCSWTGTVFVRNRNSKFTGRNRTAIDKRYTKHHTGHPVQLLQCLYTNSCRWSSKLPM